MCQHILSALSYYNDVAAEAELLKKLFANYSTKRLPVTDPSETVNVAVNLFATADVDLVSTFYLPTEDSLEDSYDLK